ncbi:MAG: hypothetical protein LUD69_02755, partial [Oscillospiraceae bacterium]|nr:hypothetical protein [Oscillospiraceae bacterium]
MGRNFATKEGVEALCEWPIPLSRKCRGRWPIGTAPRKKCRHTVCMYVKLLQRAFGGKVPPA